MNTKKRQTNKKDERQNAPWWDETCAELVRYRAEIRRRFRKGFTMEEFDFILQVEKETKRQLRKIKKEKLGSGALGSVEGKINGEINANADSKAIENNTEALKNITITAKKSHNADKDHEVLENAGKVTSEQGGSPQHPQTSKSEILENQTASTDTPEKMIKCQITRSDEIDKISNIYYSFNDSPFGRCLIGVTENNDKEKAICHLSFVDNDATDEAINQLKIKFPNTDLIEEDEETKQLIKIIFYSNNTKKNVTTVPVVIKGTAFQMKVWEVLTKIPVGTLVTYKEVADMINSPTAARAVGGAVKANQIGFLIPCHRVVNKNGCNKFGWGAERKVKMQEFEKQIIS